MTDYNALIASYLAGEATADEETQLFAWVQASPDNTAAFARACSLHAQLSMHLGGTLDAAPRKTPPAQASHRLSVWQERVGLVNQFLLAAALLMMLQASWGAVTLLRLCRDPLPICREQAGVAGWTTELLSEESGSGGRRADPAVAPVSVGS